MVWWDVGYNTFCKRVNCRILVLANSFVRRVASVRWIISQQLQTQPLYLAENELTGLVFVHGCPKLFKMHVWLRMSTAFLKHVGHLKPFVDSTRIAWLVFGVFGTGRGQWQTGNSADSFLGVKNGYSRRNWWCVRIALDSVKNPADKLLSVRFR